MTEHRRSYRSPIFLPTGDTMTNLSQPAAPASPPIAVHLTHACPIVRAGLAAILSAQPDMHVTAGDPSTTMPRADVLVTDYISGIAAAGQSPAVLVLTTQDKEWTVRHAVDSGVAGYLLQGCAPEELVDCVRMLSRGDAYLSPPAILSVVNSLARAALTRRETDVLHELARGCSDKLIARQLGIGTGTVKFHVKQLLNKLEANARTQAVVVAIERGLLGDRPVLALPPALRPAARR
jgi:DNA-binding NarL/FixJ family response regulator